jgi:hypothetical protein
MSYTKLSSSILTSTLWMEDDATRIVWVTMLAMKDRHGEVMGSVPGLANIARVPVAACRAAIQKFLSPDPDSRTSDYDGRRIEVIRGGWAVLNHAAYRDLDSDHDRKQRDAIRQQRCRAKKPLPAPNDVTVSRRDDAMSQRDSVTSHARSAIQMQISDTDSKAVKTEENTSMPDSGESSGESAPDSGPGHTSKDDGFEELWDAYGLKKSRPPAESAWRNLSKKSRAAAMAAVPAYVASTDRYDENTGKPKRKYLQGWLNARRWEDEITVSEFRPQAKVSPEFTPDPPSSPDIAWALQQIANAVNP